MNNFEEKVLSVLEQHGKMLEHHGRLLEKLSIIQEQQGKTLERHSKTLEQQGKTLEQHSKTLEQQGKTLEQHSKMLGKLSKTQDQQGKTLEQHSKTLKHQGKTLEGLMSEVAYVKMRAENASESIAVIEVDHGRKIGALFDMVSRIQDDTKETNAIVKSLHEKQENQELSIKWIDSRLKKSAV